MSPTEPRPDRRTFLLLGAGAGAALLSGCSLNNPFSTAKTPAAVAVRDLEPDVAIAVQALTALLSVQGTVAETLSTHPRLRRRIPGLEQLHEVHSDTLQKAVPKQVEIAPLAPPAPVPSNPGAALKNVVSQERGLHDQFVAFALRAESGPFARLLGSMAAAISQQLATVSS